MLADVGLASMPDDVMHCIFGALIAGATDMASAVAIDSLALTNHAIHRAHSRCSVWECAAAQLGLAGDNDNCARCRLLVRTFCHADDTLRTHSAAALAPSASSNILRAEAVGSPGSSLHSSIWDSLVSCPLVISCTRRCRRCLLCSYAATQRARGHRSTS
jgi:hypothetical protein